MNQSIENIFLDNITSILSDSRIDRSVEITP